MHKIMYDLPNKIHTRFYTHVSLVTSISVYCNHTIYMQYIIVLHNVFTYKIAKCKSDSKEGSSLLISSPELHQHINKYKAIILTKN